jgi:hypothetical protein
MNLGDRALQDNQKLAAHLRSSAASKKKQSDQNRASKGSIKQSAATK